MNTVLNSYSELIALTKLYILREHTPNEQMTTDPKTFQFFKSQIPQTKTSAVKPKPEIIQPKPDFPPSQPIQPPKPQPNIPQTPKPSEIRTEIPPKPKNEVKENKGINQNFTLEPLTTISPLEYEEFKQFTKKTFPQISVKEEIPHDEQALKIKNAWQNENRIPPVILLSFNDGEKNLAFLKNVANAITQNLAPARVLSAFAIEKENKWEQMLNSPELKLVIASDYGLYLLPGLMKFYKENARTAKHLLHQTPLLLLSDISLYLKEPQLKPLFWRAISTEFEATK